MAKNLPNLKMFQKIKVIIENASDDDIDEMFTRQKNGFFHGEPIVL